MIIDLLIIANVCNLIHHQYSHDILAWFTEIYFDVETDKDLSYCIVYYILLYYNVQNVVVFNDASYSPPT